LVLGSPGRLTNLDQVPVRIAEVAADLRSTVLRWGQELGTTGVQSATVGERHERGLTVTDDLASEHLRVEAARALDVVGDDEAGTFEGVSS
jgi:hypothetical protein